MMRRMVTTWAMLAGLAGGCGGAEATRCPETRALPPTGEHGTGGPATPAGDPAAAQRALERLIALSGEWRALQGGQASAATFTPIARGQALMQQSGFTAIYYRDGGTLMVSLFPDDGFQARLRATPDGGDTLAFAWEDGTNLAADGPRGARMEMRFTSADEVVQTWHWGAGAAAPTFEIALQRVPASAVAHAPYPYTAEQIRDATPQGRTWEYRLEEAGRRTPRTRLMTVVARTDENVEIETSLREGRRVVEAPARGTSTWDELRRHATFPAGSTLITEESVTTPAGTFACRVYTVARPAAEGQPATLSRFYFANVLPGAPVLFYTEAGGQRVMTQTLVRHSPPPVNEPR